MLQHGPTVASILEKMQRDGLGGFKPVDHGRGRHDPAHRIEHRHHRRPQARDAGALLTNAQSALTKSIFPVELFQRVLEKLPWQREFIVGPPLDSGVDSERRWVEYAGREI
jgi:hypothetical protein